MSNQQTVIISAIGIAILIIGLFALVKQTSGNGIWCFDACGPCSSYGTFYVEVNGKCVLPDNLPKHDVIITEDSQIEITGEDAWAICGALRIPCPSNPVFRGEKLDEFTTSVGFTGPLDVYEILLNKTHVCVTSTQAKTTECSLR